MFQAALDDTLLFTPHLQDCPDVTPEPKIQSLSWEDAARHFVHRGGAGQVPEPLSSPHDLTFSPLPWWITFGVQGHIWCDSLPQQVDEYPFVLGLDLEMESAKVGTDPGALRAVFPMKTPWASTLAGVSSPSPTLCRSPCL